MNSIKIEGGVTAAKGFLAAGLRAGVKPGKTNKDMAMIVSEVPAVSAGTFTRNVVKAAPVLIDQKTIKEYETAKAIVVNSGNANACTGAKGLENVRATMAETAKALSINKEEVLVCSTGVIGQQLPIEAILEGCNLLAKELTGDMTGGQNAAEAILTTDTRDKQVAVKLTIGSKEVIIGAMCKGSGMIHPNMGTMLGFVTTDANISKVLLQKALSEVIEDTFNMVSVDGDTSTNDTVLVLANGLAENPLIEEENEDYQIFKAGLYDICEALAKMIAGDGEGCTRLFEVTASGAVTKEEAKILAKSVVTSSLTKAAVFGKDANWGRILCAMGYSGAQFDPEAVDITLESENGKIDLVKSGVATDYSEELATEILSANPVKAYVNVNQGDVSATAWGCDLTYEYVSINADYRS